MIKDLTNGNVPKQLLTFALPLILSGFLQTAYNMVDMIVVGQYVNKAGLAAVSISTDVLHFLTFIAMGFSNAGQVIISQYVGSGQQDKIKRLIGTLFTFLLGASLIMTFVCFFLTDSILVWMNTSAESYDYAKDYVIVCILGLFFIYGYNLVSAILRGMGDSMRPFMFVGVAAVLNIVLDLLFVAHFHWGTMGAALATVIGQALSFLWSLVYLYRRREEFGFDFKLESFGIKMDVFSPLISLGIPMVLQSAAITLSMLVVNSFINSYGTVATAVTGVGNKLSTISNMFAQSMSTAGSSMIAQNIGAEKYERVTKVIVTSLTMIACITAILCAIIYAAPRGVFGIFSDDVEVLDMAEVYVPIALVMFASCIFRSPFMALISGSGNAKLNLMIALLDGVICRIGFAMFMGLTLEMGIFGFWYGNAIAGYMPFVVGGIYYLSGKWKTRKYLLEKQ